jgi:hypothetical protein
MSEAMKAGLLKLEVKDAQLEASDSDPLTFCFGRVLRAPELKYLLDDTSGERFKDGPPMIWGDGCGVVFVDSVTPSRPVFRRYCSTCGESRSRRRAKVVDRVEAAVWAERVPALGGWRLACSGCGERFFATTPQRRRCDRCRH